MSRFRPAGLSDEHSLIAQLVDDLVDSRVAPHAEVIAAAGRLDPELADELDQHGLLAIDVPAARGGAGADLRAVVLAIAGLARGSAAVASLPAISHAVAAACLAGDEPAARSWQAGGPPIAFADAGAERAEVATAADGWKLNGRLSGVEAPLSPARLLVVFESDGGPIAALLDADREGVSVGAPEARTGLQGAGARPVEFVDVAIGRDELVGGEGSAAAARQCYLLGTACRANGVARAALDAAVPYLDERHQFDVRLADMAGLRAIAAAASARLASAEAAVWELAGREDALLPERSGACGEVAYACVEGALAVATDALQLHGGYGYTDDFPVERLFRDALSLRALAGGTRATLELAAAGLLGPVRA